MMVNFAADDWQLLHMIVGLFEASYTSSVPLPKIIKRLLHVFHLANKAIVYMKDDGANLGTLVATLTSMVTCNPLGMATPYVGTFHVMSKKK